MAGSSSEPHVAVMPFPFGSHPMSLFNFVRTLAYAAPKVQFSFFNTSKSNNSSLMALKSNSPDNIKNFDVPSGMPANLVIGENLVEEVELFLKATPGNYNKGFKAAVAETGKKITCLMTNVMLTFSLQMAEEMHVPWIPVWTAAPWSLSAHCYTDRIHQLVANIEDHVGMEKTLEVIPGLSAIRFVDLPGEILSPKSLFSTLLGQTGQVLKRAKVVVMKSYQELYPKDLVDDLKSNISCPLYLGFLSHPLPHAQQQLTNSDDPTGCLSWLDEQKAHSVVYISFGTALQPPLEELVALAEALEESGVPYLWSLKDYLKQQLPIGFLQMTTRVTHGKVVPWTPQARVLAHDSICVFVTHCGFNAIAESITNGIPMIVRPVFADQKMNGRFVQNVWEIGVEVEDRVITKNGILKSFQLVMEHERGKKMKENIVALKEIVEMAAGPNGSAMQDFKTLLEVISSI